MGAVFKGRLERWYEDKGFGFIQPEQSKKDIFIHILALKNMPADLSSAMSFIISCMWRVMAKSRPLMPALKELPL